MASSSTKLKVEGIPEVTRALDKVQSSAEDLSEAHKAEAEMLLPDVQSATRHASGTLASSWQTDSIATEARFMNEVDYAVVQEFGWSEHNIEPTNAINNAFERNAERTEAIYTDAIKRFGSAAGFDTE